MKFRYLIFDLDGTLVDSVRDLAKACNFIRGAFGLSSLPVEVLRSFVGDGIKDLISRTLQDYQRGDLMKGYELFNRYYREHCTDNCELYPEVRETLTRLKDRGYQLSVATNKLQTFALDIIGHLGLDRHFDLVIGGDSLERKKPHPDQLNHIMDFYSQGISDIRGLTLMIGDSANDLLSARAAGVKVAILPYGYAPDHLKLDADIHLKSFSDLENYV